jgi:signal transduction histidine kinase
VHVNLSVKDDDLLMTIKDDGKSFDISQIDANELFPGGEHLGGNGIKNMHARANDLNAELAIHSTINEGTTVQLTVRL